MEGGQAGRRDARDVYRGAWPSAMTSAPCTMDEHGHPPSTWQESPAFCSVMGWDGVRGSPDLGAPWAPSPGASEAIPDHPPPLPVGHPHGLRQPPAAWYTLGLPSTFIRRALFAGFLGDTGPCRRVCSQPPFDQAEGRAPSQGASAGEAWSTLLDPLHQPLLLALFKLVLSLACWWKGDADAVSATISDTASRMHHPRRVAPAWVWQYRLPAPPCDLVRGCLGLLRDQVMGIMSPMSG